ncbi:hypothetical protein QVD17_05220 [Tagetes erecta]|uniref:Jacalin-type lectin domain-containing protein n=1 Tax=Tagetes erecta TaxID=13708 RepID=A0AAD8LDE1_TARER|nr:hypothetical protein QVD17_05220 [Tagetes erecta]
MRLHCRSKKVPGKRRAAGNLLDACIRCQMDNMFKLEPPNMKGQIWDEKSSSELVEILISHDEDFIRSMRFTYRTGQQVEFDYPGEVLTSVSGDRVYDNGRLTSIVFGTNKRNYGPFGRTGSRSNCFSYKDFKYEFKPGRFGGFHGSVEYGYVYAVGVYVKTYVANSSI